MSAQPNQGVPFVLFGSVHAPMATVFAGGWKFNRPKDSDPATWFKVSKDDKFQSEFYEGITSVTLYLMGTPIELKSFELERFLIWHKLLFGERLVESAAPLNGPRGAVPLPGR